LKKTIQNKTKNKRRGLKMINLTKITKKILINIFILLIIKLVGIINESYAVNVSPVYVSPVYVNRVYVNPVYVSPIYVNPVYVNRVYVSPTYVPQVMINRTYVNTNYVSPVYVNPTYVNRVYVNQYNPYKILNASYKNIRVSYFDYNKQDFSN
jgi:hypothetical protein